MIGYSSRPLREIDREGLPRPEAPEPTSPGECKCSHDRTSHYHGKTDHYGTGYHACLVWRCDCSSYQRGVAK